MDTSEYITAIKESFYLSQSTQPPARGAYAPEGEPRVYLIRIPERGIQINLPSRLRGDLIPN
jgi:hypothetical protein